MTILHRFLSEDMTNVPLCESPSCLKELSDSGPCGPICLSLCPSYCRSRTVDVTDLSPPPVIHHYIDEHLKRILIISTSSIITTLFLLTLLVLCFKWYNRRRSIALSRRWSMEEARNWDFNGPSQPVIVDHPVWHIRTIGLNPTVISSIKVCKYSKTDGVVEGTDCSVCLSEFEEEETLRLLPKCRHAFHVPCIDTWLRSHTNCPVCRAPVVAVSDDGGDNVEEILVRIPEEESGELNEETERGDEEEEADEFYSIVVSDEEEEDKWQQRVRRSVSLSSLSGLRVSEVVVAGRGKEKVKRGNVGSSVVGRSSFLKRSISYNGK
ncbi:unnamed protein product [Eruca vesicaria subsp. sativa]|uniref:RING-type E3 ubiquitin transferase n=1 Tax=Eruca vesicaria subsp. sativa TaxID=29727 RepID=A0ABC8L8E5_ERUVS|nr:unnamed protein product [Eruca vesicaria subsp. sativa]